MNSSASKHYFIGGLGGLILLAIPFLLPEYPLHLINISGIWIILALSLGLLQGYLGEISMGHAAFYGIGAYTSALLTMKVGLSFWVSLPMSAMITMVFGYLIGLVSLRLRGPYFAICTLGFGEIIRMVFVNWREMSGGPDGITGIPSPQGLPIPFLGTLNFTGKEANYFLIYIMVVVTLGIMIRLIHSRPGRAFMAIREDPVYAECIGINANAVQATGFYGQHFFCRSGRVSLRPLRTFHKPLFFYHRPVLRLGHHGHPGRYGDPGRADHRSHPINAHPGTLACHPGLSYGCLRSDADAGHHLSAPWHSRPMADYFGKVLKVNLRGKEFLWLF